MNLYELPLNEVGIVNKLNCDGNIRRRLLDLGVVKGTKIIPVFKSPSGDPIAYEIRKTLIALRKEDSSLINLKWIVGTYPQTIHLFLFITYNIISIIRGDFMGLTSDSTGTNLLSDTLEEIKRSCDFTVAFAGNPNVGKSTIFNSLTGMHQHTGNWPGKTVSNASGTCNYMNKNFLFIDIPGTYSIMSNSQEEEIARDYICFGKPDVTVVVTDATCLERNLNLVFQTMEITKNIIVCVNLLDEAKKKNIHIDLKAFENYLGVPVVGTTARNPATLKELLNCIYKVCIGKKNCHPNLIKYEPIIEDAILSLQSEISKVNNSNFDYINRWIALKLLDGDSKILNSIEKSLSINLHTLQISSKLDEIKKGLLKNDITQETIKDSIVSSIMRKSEEIAKFSCSFKNKDYNLRNKKIDSILTSKKYGIPIMLLFLGIIFWITIIGANYPSSLLSNLFNIIQNKLLYISDTSGK